MPVHAKTVASDQCVSGRLRISPLSVAGDSFPFLLNLRPAFVRNFVMFVIACATGVIGGALAGFRVRARNAKHVERNRP